MLYEDQTLLDLRLEAGILLTSATDIKIIVLKPDNTRVELDGSFDVTKIIFSNPPGQNNFSLDGPYQFQGKFTIDGRTAYTNIITRIFHKNL